MGKQASATEDYIEPEILPQEDDLVVFVETEGKEGQLQLLHVDDFAFDEMNLVEIPFCTLQKQTSVSRSISLSPTGDEYLECVGSKHPLPTSLAEPTVLGLLWLTKNKNGFKSPKVTFALRDLVESYMYPGRFSQYRASGKLMTSVERELHRIASTRLHSRRWYDRSLEKHVEIDAAIIDSITIRHEGGKHRSRVLEIVWGNKIFQSVQNQYTKNFDVKTWLQISQPLDRRLFRWLDRQLDTKNSQMVKSCQNWAKHKMLMQCYKIEKGGRTASGYILNKVTDSLKRLNGLDFGVRLVVDKSQPDFSFRFDRIADKSVEVLDWDETGELVFEFKKIFHEVKKRGRLKESDRRVAAAWIESYGFDKAVWMVGRCRVLHLEGKRSDETIYSFKGLEFYETRAEADYERMKDNEAGQLDLVLEKEQREKWAGYRERKLAEAERTLDIASLRNQARARAQAAYPEAFTRGFAKDRLIDAELRKLELEELGAMTEDQFSALSESEKMRLST